jgi:HPt (histidine-containing phosphotransfer) domain-containing protein
VDELYVTLKPYAQSPTTTSDTLERTAPMRALSKPAPPVARQPVPTPGSPLNEQALKQIRSLRKPGGPDLLKRIVDLYLSNSRTLIGTLRDAVIRNDAAAVLQAAHSLKSSSTNVGATGLGELCAKLEASALAGNLGSAWPHLERLVEEYEQVVLALNAQTVAA